MQGKVCLVTGANSGLGRAAALALAKRGATVVMACRDRGRGEEAALAAIKAASGSSAVDLLVLDLAAQQSVRDAAAGFLSRYERLDVLVNNAATFKAGREVTPEWAGNHVRHESSRAFSTNPSAA